jgi:HTH-type transcriptional regulator / antitoxin HigA
MLLYVPVSTPTAVRARTEAGRRIVITNEVKYRATKAHLDQFEQAAANIECRPGQRTKLERLELDAIRSQADDLRAELADYDQLRGGGLSTFDAASLEELSTVLVKARIARGWTQRQLADALGLAEQQIQRYEANDYRSTSLARLCDIANALAVTITHHAVLRSPVA